MRRQFSWQGHHGFDVRFGRILISRESACAFASEQHRPNRPGFNAKNATNIA
jgi:hypothetical protein